MRPLPYRIELERTAPGADLLTEFKAHMRVTGSAQDTELTRYLNRAARDLEDDTARLVVQATVKEHYDVWPWNWVTILELARAPVASVTSIKYYDSDGNQQTWDSSNYETDLVAEPARIAVAADATDISPTLNDQLKPVTIEYESGLVDASGDGTAADVDAQTKNAIFVRAAWLAGPGRELTAGYDQAAVDRCWAAEINRLRWTL